MSDVTPPPAPRPGQEGLPPPMAKNFRESRTSLCAQLVSGARVQRGAGMPLKCCLPLLLYSDRHSAYTGGSYTGCLMCTPRDI